MAKLVITYSKEMKLVFKIFLVYTLVIFISSFFGLHVIIWNGVAVLYLNWFGV